MAEEKTKKLIEGSVEFPKELTCSVSGKEVSFKGEKGELKKEFNNPFVNIELKDNTVLLKPKRQTKREKKIIGTFISVLKNMIKGVTEGHKYVLKICSGHFPMNVSVKGKELIIKNFIGEKNPRVLLIKEGANVKVEGEEIIVESVDKALAGMVSAEIENMTKRPNFDTRIFQDGIYIINKDGKQIA